MSRKNIFLYCLSLFILINEYNCQNDQTSIQSNNENLLSSGGYRKINNGGSRYCGNSLVRALRLICDGAYAEPSLKRSLDSNNVRHNLKNKIWQERFNLKDFDLLTWYDLDLQYQILFGSEVHKKKLPFKLLFKSYVDNEIDDHINYKRNEDSPLIRNIRGIYDECCAKPCTVKYMKTYCLNRLL